MPEGTCTFCRIAAGEGDAERVLADDDVVAFLDARPVFPGHVLVVPRAHYETLVDLPGANVGTMFTAVQRVATGVQEAMEAHGTFVAVNNRVSQSVPHLHVHVVPRRFKDGLRGFFWPRQRYESDDQKASVASAIRAAIAGG